MRIPLIGANWKMHKNPNGTTAFFETFLPLVKHSGHCEIVICPTLLDVENAVAATNQTRIEIGAQNLYWEDEGAFTGEVSGSMIKAAGCSHVIVGHSERRHFFGETDEDVFKKTVAALDAGLIPIVCNCGAVPVGHRWTYPGSVCENRDRLRAYLGDWRR